MTDYSELEVPDHLSYQDETYDHGSRDDNNGQLDGREGSGARARPWTPITVLSPDMSDEDEQDALAYLIDDEDSDDTIVVNDEASYLGSSDDTTVGSRSSDETIIASPGFIRLPDYGGYPLFRLSSRGGSPSSSMICEGSSDSDDGVIMGSIGRVADYDDDDDDDDYHQSEPLIPGDCSPKFTAEDPLPPIGYPELYANEYFQIQDSHLSGLGAFSVRDIEQGTVILTEKALFHATERNLYDVLEQLHPDYQASFNRLHAYYQSPRIDRKTAIFRTNGFATTEGLSIFLVASRFNNACPKRNNLEFSYNKAKQCLVLKASKDIPAKTELTIFYGGTPPVLFQKWGFRCTCGACQPLTNAECSELTCSSLNWYS